MGMSEEQRTAIAVDRDAHSRVRELFDNGSLPSVSVCQACGEEKPKEGFGYSVVTKTLWKRCFDCVDVANHTQNAVRKERLSTLPATTVCESCGEELPTERFSIRASGVSRSCMRCMKLPGYVKPSSVKRALRAAERSRTICEALEAQGGRCSVCKARLTAESWIMIRKAGTVECGSHPFFPGANPTPRQVAWLAEQKKVPAEWASRKEWSKARKVRKPVSNDRVQTISYEEILSGVSHG